MNVEKSNNLFSLFDVDEIDSEKIDITKFELRVVDSSFAKDFMSTHHYSQTCPNLYYALGFYHEGQLACLACYGPPGGRLIAQALLNDGTAKNVSELVRLFAFDWSPKNTESYCIGKSINWLKHNCPNLELLVSYADPNWGHLGIIYQATNWLYTGQGSRIVDAYEFFIDGEWTHPRTVFAQCGTTNLKKVNAFFGRDIEVRLIKHKHRYIYILGDKRQRKNVMGKLKVSAQSYPKKPVI